MSKTTLMCPLGKSPFATKREAQDANPGMSVARCGRCRNWHAAPKRGKGR